MSKPAPRFIKAFTVHFRPEDFLHLYPTREDYLGHLEPCPRQERPGWQSDLNGYQIARTRYVGEKYLEEWVARRADALFGEAPVLLLCAEKYRPRLGFLDLLFVDRQSDLHVVELKIEPVAENAGILPCAIAEQMDRYVKELRAGDSFKALATHYAAFTNSFRRQLANLQADLRRCFGTDFSLADLSKSAIREIFLAADFDEQSYLDLSDRSRSTGRAVRMIYFRFYSPSKRGNVPYLEFWEYPV